MSPRKSKKRNRDNAATWAEHQLVVVLAWADHSLEIDPGGKVFKNSVESHFAEACQVNYTWSQIRSKLGWLWANYGREGVPNWPNLILKEGSKCLENPYFPLHEAIARRRAALAAIAHEKSIEQLSRRTTRSASSFVSTSLLWSTSGLDYDSAASASPRKKARIGPAQRFPSRRTETIRERCTQLAGTLQSVELPKQERWHTPPDTPGRQSTIQDSFSEGTMTRGSCEHEHNYSRRTSPGSEACISPQLQSMDIEAKPCIQAMQLACASKIANASTQTNPDQGEEQSKISPGRQWCALQDGHKAELAFYVNKLEKAEKEAKALKHQLESLRSVFQATRTGHSLELLLADSRNKSNTLDNTLADRTLLNTFSSLASTEPVSCDKRSVVAIMESMGTVIKNLASLDNTRFCHTTTITDGSDLAQLILRGFPGIKPHNSSSSLVNRIPQHLKLNDVLRTLVAAAICSWVFEAPLDFLRTRSPCHLLTLYRQCLEKQDGPRALRNLDFAAHTMLLLQQDNFFLKEVVPSVAKRLTDDLCKTLRPLFANQEHSGLSPQSSLYGISDAGPDDISSLQKIFKGALEVKTRLILSTNVYEAIIYAPGTLCSQKRMVAKNEPGKQIESILHQRPQIKCCWLPALVEHENSKDLVDQVNFIQSSQADNFRLKPFSKALVLI